MRLSVCLLVYLVGAQSSYSYSALRDPFRLASGLHSYVLMGVGIIHNKNERFAILFIDGISYQVCKQDIIAGHTVISIFDAAIILKNEAGKEFTVYLK